MKAIEQNPYRILGLLAGATAREQSKQVNRLKQYLEAEQDPPTDFSFPALGKIQRTLDSVETAVSKLNLDADKMSAALFWFYKGNEITDEPAFEKLMDGDVNAAKNIWGNLIFETRGDGKTYWKEVTRRNHSAFHNWFVLETLMNKADWVFWANIKFLETDFVYDFIKLITDATYQTTKKDLQLLFLNQVILEMEIVNVNKFVKNLKSYTFTAKDEFLNIFTSKKIEQIEKKIKDTKEKRKNNSANAVSAGNELYATTGVELNLLKDILGIDNIKYSSITDKAADEILQCGIDFFNRYKENENGSIPNEHLRYVGSKQNENFSDLTMDLFIRAKMIAVGDYVKQRCQETIKDLQKWIDDKPERDKQKKIENDLKALVQLWEDFEYESETIANAKDLINQAKRYLGAIKNVLGYTDSIYLKLSTRTALQAQSYIIEEINSVQDSVMRELQTTYSQYGKLQVLARMKQKLTEAWEATELLGSLDMERDFRINRYNPNKESLKNLCNQLGVSTSVATNTPKPQFTPPQPATPTPTTHQQTVFQTPTQNPPKEEKGNVGCILVLVSTVIMIPIVFALNENGGKMTDSTAIPLLILMVVFIVGMFMYTNNK